MAIDPLRTLGAVQAPTRAIAYEVNEYLNEIGDPLPIYPDYESSVMWGMGTSGEHSTGRAIDFMIRNSPHVGDEIVAYLWKHRERFGLIHYIYKQSIRSTRVKPGEDRPMSDRGSVTENHYDHVHAYFDGRAVQPLPVDAVRVPVSVPGPDSDGYAHALIRRGARGADVRHAQAMLRVTADGIFGAYTERATRSLQTRKGLTIDGIIGPKTWEALHEWDKDPFTHATISKGDRGKDVRHAQQMLHSPTVVVDGIFGAKTRNAVIYRQRTNGATADGIVGPITWGILHAHDKRKG